MTRTFIIDESSLPSLPHMMLATLNALREMSGSASIHELDEKVAEMEGVTEEEQSYTMLKDDRTRLKYFLGWARTYLKRGGALENSARGVWSLTDKGKNIISIDGINEIYEQVQLEERERTRKRNLEKKLGDDTAQPSEDKNIESDDASIGDDPQADWKHDLLNVIKEMKPDAFERLSAKLLRAAGFKKVEVRGKVADGGIDGIGVLSMNLLSFQVYFQCKRYKGSVGSKEIRDFRGALQGRADKGLFITTGHFTSHASNEATRDGAIAIDLIDGDEFCELLKENGLGVETKMVEEVTVKSDWFAGV